MLKHMKAHKQALPEPGKRTSCRSGSLHDANTSRPPETKWDPEQKLWRVRWGAIPGERELV